MTPHRTSEGMIRRAGWRAPLQLTELPPRSARRWALGTVAIGLALMFASGFIAGLSAAGLRCLP